MYVLNGDWFLKVDAISCFGLSNCFALVIDRVRGGDMWQIVTLGTDHTFAGHSCFWFGDSVAPLVAFDDCSHWKGFLCFSLHSAPVVMAIAVSGNSRRILVSFEPSREYE